jgi:ACR3 family arsenite efflux pump ArsB
LLGNATWQVLHIRGFICVLGDIIILMFKLLYPSILKFVLKEIHTISKDIKDLGIAVSKKKVLKSFLLYKPL